MSHKNKLAVLLGFALLLAIPQTHAQPRGHFDDRRREEEDMRRREEERRRWAYDHPIHHEIIAPAPVVYAPPPPSPGLSIVLPINFH